MGPAKLRSFLVDYQPLKDTKRAVFFSKHGEVMVPFIEDPNTGVEMFESREIVKYLEKEYEL